MSIIGDPPESMDAAERFILARCATFPSIWESEITPQEEAALQCHTELKYRLNEALKQLEKLQLNRPVCALTKNCQLYVWAREHILPTYT